MSRSARLRLQDLRAIHALVGDCRDLGDDPALWRAHTAAAAPRIIGADLCLWFEGLVRPHYVIDCRIASADTDRLGFSHAAQMILETELVQRGLDFNPMFPPFFARAEGAGGVACAARTDLVRDHDWYGSDYYQHFVTPVGSDALMYSIRPLPGGRWSGITGARSRRDRDFSPRARAVAAELHAQLAPLVGGPLAALTEPSPSDLPPRARQVLRCLLEGDGDKQIALRLGVTRHTVNEHAKRIFTHFGVTSRTELLARWVRRGWGARFAWADDVAQ